MISAGVLRKILTFFFYIVADISIAVYLILLGAIYEHGEAVVMERISPIVPIEIVILAAALIIGIVETTEFVLESGGYEFSAAAQAGFEEAVQGAHTGVQKDPCEGSQGKP